MKNYNEIQEELKAIAPTFAAWEKRNPFSVPEDYFGTLPQRILTTVQQEEDRWENVADPQMSFLLQSFKNRSPFSLPENYFPQASASILSAIRKQAVKEELQEIAPEVAALPKNNPFQVPHNYFNTLPQQVLYRLHRSAASTAEVSIWNKCNEILEALLHPFFKPQFAMAFAIVVSLAVFFAFLNDKKFLKSDSMASLHHELKKVSANEVNLYIASNIDEFDEYSLKKKVGNINSLVMWNDLNIDRKSFEEIILPELEEDMILELPS
jgi:hypothetical protein